MKRCTWVRISSPRAAIHVWRCASASCGRLVEKTGGGKPEQIQDCGTFAFSNKEAA